MSDSPKPATPVREIYPGKRMAAGAVIRDPSGRILIVKPTYKDGWEIPGGVVEANESPRGCCSREILEELGVALPVGELMAVDWVSNRSLKPEGVMFVFDGGVIDDELLSAVRLPPDELSDWRLVLTSELQQYLPPPLADRVIAGLGSMRAIYLEDGVAAGAVVASPASGRMAAREKGVLHGHDDDRENTRPARRA